MQLKVVKKQPKNGGMQLTKIDKINLEKENLDE